MLLQTGVEGLVCRARSSPQLGWGERCHLERYTSHTYTLRLQMASGSSLFRAGEELEVRLERRLELEEGRRVRVAGSLQPGRTTALDPVTSITPI